MSNTDFLGRAIETVKKAIELDTAGNYKDAYTWYMNSLDLFMLALKWERNAKSKEVVRQKTAEYMDRAEKLKTTIDPGFVRMQNECGGRIYGLTRRSILAHNSPHTAWTREPP